MIELGRESGGHLDIPQLTVQMSRPNPWCPGASEAVRQCWPLELSLALLVGGPMEGNAGLWALGSPSCTHRPVPATLGCPGGENKRTYYVLGQMLATSHTSYFT